MNTANSVNFNNIDKEFKTIADLSKGQKLCVHSTTGELSPSGTNSTTWSGYALQPLERFVGQKIGYHEQNWKAVALTIQKLILQTHQFIHSDHVSFKEICALKVTLKKASDSLLNMASYDYANKPAAKKSFENMASDIKAVIKQSNDEMKSKEIRKFAKEFLFPYIQGYITAENAPVNPKPWIELVKEKWGGDTPHIEETALKSFLEESAMGLYVHNQIDKKTDLDERHFMSMQALCKGLESALLLHFPNLEIDRDNLYLIALEALKNATADRRAGIDKTDIKRQ